MSSTDGHQLALDVNALDRVLSDDEFEDLNEPTGEAVEVSYSSQDFSVDSLVTRLRRRSMVTPRFNYGSDDVQIPGFQRGFVWTKSQMDRFIESLLLGYPAPGLFLVRQQADKRMLILDGQQRLTTLYYFYEGTFRDKVFRLEHVADRFKGLTYENLDPAQRNTLDDAYMAATIVTSDGSRETNEAIFNIFERLNSGGTALTPHEIRVALFAGDLMESIAEMNSDRNWRALYGPPSKRLRDHELILRILALFNESENYSRPMKRFLNSFSESNRDFKLDWPVFQSALQEILDGIGGHAFVRNRNQVNAAQAESVVVGVMKNIDQNSLTADLGSAFEALTSDPVYIQATGRATADNEAVRNRISKAVKVFQK